MINQGKTKIFIKKEILFVDIAKSVVDILDEKYSSRKKIKIIRTLKKIKVYYQKYYPKNSNLKKIKEAILSNKADQKVLEKAFLYLELKILDDKPETLKSSRDPILIDIDNKVYSLMKKIRLKHDLEWDKTKKLVYNSARKFHKTECI
jgi:hypothetical protein